MLEGPSFSCSRVELGEVGNEDVGESKNPGPDLSPDVRVGPSRALLFDVDAHLFPGGTSLLGDLLSKVLADDVHLLAYLVPVGDADRRCLCATLTKEHRFADPAALRSVPKVVEVHLPKVAVGDIDGNAPARRLLVNIVVAVKEAGTIGVVVALLASLAGARFEHSEYQT